MIATLTLILLTGPLAAQPVQSVWIRSQQPPSELAIFNRTRPDVHSVEVGPDATVVRSAGFSLANLGLLAAPPSSRPVTEFTFRIPLVPGPASGAHAHVPADYTGVFVNGVPIYNHLEAASYRGQNLWHYDLVARNDNGQSTVAGFVRPELTHPSQPGLLERLAACTGKHSPLIGFALDGYPVYGPCSAAGRQKSSYRLRAIVVRDRWPDRTLLAPGQSGPPVTFAYPLGTFGEDYEYVAGSGDLDRYNGRFAVTPEYPQGTYAYYLSTAPDGRLAFPYLLAHEFYGEYSEAKPFFPSASEKRVAFQAPSAATGRPVPLRFQIRDAAGRPIRHLEHVHERPLHLLIVSLDLGDFAHLHPEVNAQGTWEATHVFPRAGRYRLYAEFTLPGGPQQVTNFDLTVAGIPRPSRPPLPSALVKLDRTVPLQAGEDLELQFDLSPPLSGLEPYLGAWAHVVIVGEGLSSFLHAHPLEKAGAVQSEAHFHTAESLGPAPAQVRIAAIFPRAGRYRLWLQVQVAGSVRVIPFDLQVASARTARAVTNAIPPGAIRLQIGPDGFAPARLSWPANQAVTLAITRSTAPNCGRKVVFPDLGLEREIPLGVTVLLPLPARPAGELRFTCGMGMYRGSLLLVNPKQ